MKRHPLDPVSLVFGVLFLAVAALVALPASPFDLLEMGDILAWLLPIALVGVGAALLVPAMASDTGDEDEPAEDHSS